MGRTESTVVPGATWLARTPRELDATDRAQEAAMERIGLLEAVTALRTELAESILAAANEQIRFAVGEITLEFQVEVERTASASAGIKFWVVEVGGEGSRTSTNTHTVSIPLKPVSSDGRPVLTGAQRVPR
jgi:hypothetical protein